MKHDLLVVAGWLIVTAVINALLRKRSVAEWEALAETYPRYAAVARILRSVGLDPVKLLESVVDLIKGQARSRIGSSQDGEPLKPPSEPAAAPQEEATNAKPDA